MNCYFNVLWYVLKNNVFKKSKHIDESRLSSMYVNRWSLVIWYSCKFSQVEMQRISEQAECKETSKRTFSCMIFIEVFPLWGPKWDIKRGLVQFNNTWVVTSYHLQTHYNFLILKYTIPFHKSRSFIRNRHMLYILFNLSV